MQWTNIRSNLSRTGIWWFILWETLSALLVGCQWNLATIETQTSHECQNIASAIVVDFEKCNITLLETKILRQSHVDQQTIRTRLDEIRTQSRSKQYMLVIEYRKNGTIVRKTAWNRKTSFRYISVSDTIKYTSSVFINFGDNPFIARPWDSPVWCMIWCTVCRPS